MQTVNDKTTKSSLSALMPALTLLFMALFSQAANALLLQIDPTRSEILSVPSFILFCTVDQTGELVCPEPSQSQPQKFMLTGNIDVHVIHENFDFGAGYPVVDRDLLYLKMMGLSTDALAQGFYLDVDLALMNGETFEARSDPCFLFVGPGSCSGWVIGGPSDSQGTWDGHTLTWRGYRAPYFDFVTSTNIDGFNFTIVATAVPEPGTLSLLLVMLPLMVFGMTRQSRSLFASRGI
ncbi:MAG: PEP-CTERM sorting domain-containing protein [Thiobacillus sp.]|uniref:PEP-CTERM sorting domain-containing protein n=1 Tax=Thiobacillus sp. TaxID=924 RepID=UPI002733C229|nr:PEP-CTERM sorting domain-containing protein [Thiobacillus sp.]MDP3584280.1 PEP-CTERM sorting domain-containing protein [Thiobacillus sp.]